jgi:biotin carboxyl carrier protein
MKMENVIKAEGIGVVKGLHVQVNDTAEKGALLISFE